MRVQISLQEKLAALPAEPGAYLMKDAAGTVIYVGKAASLRSRVRSYWHDSGEFSPRVSAMVDKVADFDYLATDSEVEALILESNLIKRYRPRYNVRLRDDKKYPYIKITVNEEFPRLVVVRNLEHDGAKHFGPYASTRSMWGAIRLLRRVFKIRQAMVASARKRSGCNWDPAKGLRRRPCLNYFIKQCTGPCAEEVDSKQYRAQVEQAIMFLEGKYDSLLDGLREQMEQEAENLRFECAARIRDQVLAVERATQDQKVALTSQIDADVLAQSMREDLGCVSVFQIRGGKLIGQDQFMLEGVSGLDDSQILNDFLKQYYQWSASVPAEIWLPHELGERQVISAWLGERRGKKVKLLVPRRGEKRKLVEMAAQNVQHHLQQVLEQAGAEQKRGQEAISDLQKLLGLPLPPRRIEAFDISNLFGTQAVGSMIVFQDGLPRKSDYRRFKLRLDKGTPDDYAMMKEVLQRRLGAALTRRAKFVQLPDLVLVDGGKGQLGVATKALKEVGLSIPAVALAKEHEELFVPGKRSSVALPRHSRVIHLFQRVRDEAHRFAISYHRLLRDKRAKESELDQIPGIGPKRKQELLKKFGSLRRIRSASVDELTKIPAINREVAQAVLDGLRQSS